MLYPEIDTPALLIDLDAMEANEALLLAFARQRGIALRPHAKTHKCSVIGQRQMQAGAVGLCCAKLGEAEALAAAGLTELLITAPVAGALKLERLAALHARCPGLMVVVDHPDAVSALAARLTAPLAVLIDVDVGQQRTGVTDTEMALATARRIAAHPLLELRGVQGYAGHIQHIPELDSRRTAAARAAAQLRTVRDALVAAGFPCPVVTGVGTGTYAVDPEFALYTDMQVGSYLFSDVEYDAVVLTPDAPRPLRPALFVLSQVISANQRGCVTVDAGSKSLATDGPLPRVLWPAGARYSVSGDEFGRLELPAGARLAVGERVLLMAPHCDPTINLYERYHCVRDGTQVAEWRIDARGRSD